VLKAYPSHSYGMILPFEGPMVSSSMGLTRAVHKLPCKPVYQTRFARIE
jgi:hypothetical protein